MQLLETLEPIFKVGKIFYDFILNIAISLKNSLSKDIKFISFGYFLIKL